MAKPDKATLDAVAKYLRAKGIPCGAWKMPPPDEIAGAEAAYEQVTEDIIAEMYADVAMFMDEPPHAAA